MTQEQKDFLNLVVLPKLVDMAINDTLPLDMNTLCAEHFEDEATEYNNSSDKHIKACVEEARRILCDNDELEGDEDNILQQIRLIEEFAKTRGGEYIDWVEGVIVWQKVENTYTADEFLEQIGW